VLFKKRLIGTSVLLVSVSRAETKESNKLSEISSTVHELQAQHRIFCLLRWRLVVMLRLLLLLSATAPGCAFYSTAVSQTQILYASRSQRADEARTASLSQAAQVVADSSAAAGVEDVVALPVVSEEDDDARTETSSEAAADATEAALLTAIEAPPAPLTLADWMQLEDHKFALAMAPGFFGFYAQVSYTVWL
jgi:hypothetical protein